MSEPEEKKEECVPEEKPGTPSEQTLQTKKRRGRLIAIIVGVLLVGVGFFSFFDSVEINDALIEVGAGHSVKNMIEEYPCTKEWAIKIADVLDAAIEARITSPERLTELINKAVQEHSVPGLQKLITAIIAQINATYKSSETEQEYIDKLQHLVTGIRDGIGCVTTPDVQ